MHILLTNDDGIYAPGLAALERALQSLGTVTVVAPLAEQSGVGHAITYLTPLMCREVYDGDRRRGWAVEGSPADCVKLAVARLCPERPDLVVSGINSGQNAGINVLYSGTVAAAIEGAFFGITSIAVSLEYDEQARYDEAAAVAAGLIRQILDQKDPDPQLYNLNIPTAALEAPAEVCVAPMCVVPWGEQYETRRDPRGRLYYWATGKQPTPPEDKDTDLSLLREGKITITPLAFDMTRRDKLAAMRSWQLTTDDPQATIASERGA
ncbi:MAG: 5'/3'-nucleotidase SurE [Planctomycetales bacterium]|nr:5'/3'-nucleotidase SurE [Planctomycetales bacterium]